MATLIGSPGKASSFRYEADLVASLRDALPRLAFRHEARSPVQVFTEVPAVQGVPDLAGVRFIEQNIALRHQADVRPLSSDVEVRTVMALGHDVLDVAELAYRTQTSRTYMRRAILPLLRDLGWVVLEADNLIYRRPEAVWVGRRVVTVEAKLKNWQAALSQARRQKHSADAAFIALDATKAGPVGQYLDEIARSGIGVISVDRKSCLSSVLVRPERQHSSHLEVGKNLLAERCLDMLQRGTKEGKIYPVFGEIPPSSSGDPATTLGD